MGIWSLPEYRCFDPDPAQRRLAQELYEHAAPLPIVSPHGHLDPRIFAEDVPLGTPTDLFVLSDHYVFRMLYSQGIPLERLGIPRLDGGPVEKEHRRIWQIFAENFHLFRGTPVGYWLTYQLVEVFGVREKLTRETAQRAYDHVAERLASPDFRPRALYARFRIETLCTTDAATDSLRFHRAIRESGWAGDVRPTFRPDDVFRILSPDWSKRIEALSDLTGIWVHSYAAFIQAVEKRRAFFREMGAVATDHDAEMAYTEELSPSEAEAIFQRALRGTATLEDARRFAAHMLIESARMSREDGLVMQVHVGALRNHNAPVYRRFGPDRGGDIPVAGEFTRNLRPLLNRYGNDSRLTLIVFTLDESTYSRELAPLAGHYPALRVGPPWWFHDSFHGMKRYFAEVVERAGVYNTVGFNDDARTLTVIPARHDLWRRACANWLAGLVIRGLLDEEDAHEVMLDMAYRLAKQTYRL